MQKMNQSKKLIKLMSGLLAVLIVSTPTSFAERSFELESKPSIVEKLKTFALPAAIIGGCLVITGAVVFGALKIRESRSEEELKRNVDFALKNITDKADLKHILNEIEKKLISGIENNKINEFKSKFQEFKTYVQSFDDVNAAKRKLRNGLIAIVKVFNVNFDIDKLITAELAKLERTDEAVAKLINERKVELGETKLSLDKAEIEKTINPILYKEKLKRERANELEKCKLDFLEKDSAKYAAKCATCEKIEPKVFFRAACCGKLEVVKCILEAYEIDLNKKLKFRGEREEVPLCAIMENVVFAMNLENKKNLQEIIKCFLEKGANPNVCDSDGNTPILFAAVDHNKEMYDLLIKHGADPTIKNMSGKTPKEIMEEKS